MEEIHHKTSGGATLSKFGYAYDAAGNITTWAQQHEAVSRAYDFAYDAVDQLVGAAYRTTDTVPSVLARYGYVYDKLGNRTTEQVDDAPRVWKYNNTNQMITQAGGGTLRFEGSVNEPATVMVQGQPALVDATNGFAGAASVGAGTPVVTVTATDESGNSASQAYEVDVTDVPSSFVYDLNGNLTSHGTKSYEWDAEDRLVRALDNSSEVARFTYDGLGRRAEKISGGVTRAYVYDGADIVEERAGGTTTRIVHGPAIDQPLAAVTAGTPTYFLADHLGSIAQHTDAAQQVTLTRAYDPFGNLTSGASNSGYAFTGREWDAEVGLYYYRARYYDAGLGRFISADPIGLDGGFNLYRYVENAPQRFSDPFGKEVVNRSIFVVYVKPGDTGAAVPLGPGQTYSGDQDGVATPVHKPGEVFKTGNGIDVIINPDGTVTTSGGNPVERAYNWWNGGWKDEQWQQDLNTDNDTGWDQLFNEARKNIPPNPRVTCK